MLTIDSLMVGTKRRLFEGFSIPMPPEVEGDSGITLRKLIERIVRSEVEAFNDRQHSRQFIRALTAREIADGEEKGKIDSGGSDVPVKETDVDDAIATAIEAFQDGIYFVSIDEQQHTDMDAELFLQPDSRVTFIRLTLLAGG